VVDASEPMNTFPVRILIVDDVEIIADTLAMILKAAGHNLRTAYSGESAALCVLDFDPEIVISDVMLPGMSGVDLADWITGHSPHCKVLLISGHEGTIALVEEANRNGKLYDLLAKPVPPGEILDFVATART
jgi:DNA-binding NtrC family response regulator